MARRAAAGHCRSHGRRDPRSGHSSGGNPRPVRRTGRHRRHGHGRRRQSDRSGRRANPNGRRFGQHDPFCGRYSRRSYSPGSRGGQAAAIRRHAGGAGGQQDRSRRHRNPGRRVLSFRPEDYSRQREGESRQGRIAGRDLSAPARAFATRGPARGSRS